VETFIECLYLQNHRQNDFTFKKICKPFFKGSVFTLKILKDLFGGVK